MVAYTTDSPVCCIMANNELPNDQSAEKAVLGSILIDPEVYFEVSERLQESDFFYVFHRIVFRAINTLYASEIPIDLLTLENAIRRIDDKRLQDVDVFSKLGEIQEFTPTSKNASNYITSVKESSMRRSAVGVGSDLVVESQNKSSSVEVVVDEAIERLSTLVSDSTKKDSFHDVSSAFGIAIDSLEERIKNGGNKLLGLTTGFIDLDKKTNGLQKSDLIIVAARPSMGKTSFALNMVENALVATDKPVIVFSLEMPVEQITFKMLASLGGVELDKIRSGNLDDEDWARISNTMKMLKEKDNFFIEDASGLTPTEIRNRVRQIQRERGEIGMVMVDYLQLMRVPSLSDNRTLEIAEISRSLKALAKDMQCPVVALSQLNRSLENRTDKRPVNSDLRESGSIEQDADIIMFIYRDEVYNENSEDKGVAEIIIGKQRNGPIGTVRLTTTLEYSRFNNYATGQGFNYD